jgi:hypothetical protein
MMCRRQPKGGHLSRAEGRENPERTVESVTLVGGVEVSNRSAVPEPVPFWRTAEPAQVLKISSLPSDVSRVT